MPQNLSIAKSVFKKLMESSLQVTGFKVTALGGGRSGGRPPYLGRVRLGAFACLLAACGGSKEANEDDLTHVRLQTNWYPEAEHGGFYYAQVHGYYADEGLDVEILPGGVNYVGALKVTEGQAEFALHEAEGILMHQAQGMPLEIVMATQQHDSRGIMLHADDPADDFEDLDGRTIMAMPGSTWLRFVEQRYNISLRVVPHDKGMERFLADPRFMQQCLVTSEPFFARLRGAETKVLLVKDSGFDAYHVLYTNRNWAKDHVEVVGAFVRASRRGWIDYLTKDPSPTHALIRQLNPRQSDELLNYSRQALIDGGFAFGEGGPEQFGRIDPERMEQLEAQLRALGLLGTR